MKPVPTIEKLYAWAQEHFGYDQERVKSIMKRWGITSSNPQNWWTCTSLIRQEFIDGLAEEEFPENCPICTGAIERDRFWDGKVGVKWGWNCLTNQYHFMYSRINILRILYETKSEDNHTGKEVDSGGLQ